MKTSRRIITLVALLLATLTALPSANAQLPIPLPTGTPTGDPEPEPSPTPTKTTDPEPEPTPTRTKDGGDTDDGGGEKSEPRTRPPMDPVVAKGIAQWLGRDRSPARTTDHLLALLRRAGGGALTLADKRRGFGRFPVLGDVWYQDDWLAPRHIPYFHLHEGNDIFAVSGTPVMAVVDGAIWDTSSGGTGGTAVWLMGDDGVRYYYGHLRDIVPTLRKGDRVRLGDVLGHVGATGDSAAGTYPHVHFEVNPGGRGTINPKPLLDAWLREAETAAVQQIRSLYLSNALAPLGAARWQTLYDVFAEPASAPPAMWTAAFGPTATVAYADLALGELLAAQDWSTLATFSDAGSAAAEVLSALSFLGPDPAHHGLDLAG